MFCFPAERYHDSANPVEEIRKRASQHTVLFSSFLSNLDQKASCCSEDEQARKKAKPLNARIPSPPKSSHEQPRSCQLTTAADLNGNHSPAFSGSQSPLKEEQFSIQKNPLKLSSPATLNIALTF